MQIFVRWIIPYTIISKLHSRYSWQERQQVLVGGNHVQWKVVGEKCWQKAGRQRVTSPTTWLPRATLPMLLKPCTSPRTQSPVQQVWPAHAWQKMSHSTQMKKKLGSYGIIKIGKAIRKSSSYGLKQIYPQSEHGKNSHLPCENLVLLYQVVTRFVSGNTTGPTVNRKPCSEKL